MLNKTIFFQSENELIEQGKVLNFYVIPIKKIFKFLKESSPNTNLFGETFQTDIFKNLPILREINLESTCIYMYNVYHAEIQRSQR